MVDDGEREPPHRLEEDGAARDPSRRVGGAPGREPRARSGQGDRGELAALPGLLGKLDGRLRGVDGSPGLAGEERDLDRPPRGRELEVGGAVGGGEHVGRCKLAARLREVAAAECDVGEGPASHRGAAAWIREGIAYADAIEQSYCSHILQAVGGLVAWGDGRWDDAVGEAAQALMANGSLRGAAMARWPLAYVALGRGDLAEARRQLASAHEFADAYGAPDFQLAAAWGTIEVALLSGEAGAAIDASES